MTTLPANGVLEYTECTSPATGIFKPLAFETHSATHSSALDCLNDVCYLLEAFKIHL